MNMLEEIKQINEKMIEKNTKEKNEREEFGTSLELGKYIDKIQVLGGGACGDIGIVYSANNFFITNENGNTLDEKSIMLKEENLQEISKIKYPVNMWLKKFLRGVEELRNKVETKIKYLSENI